MQRMTARLLCLCFLPLYLLMGCSGDDPGLVAPDPVPPQPIPQDRTAWLQNNALPFDTADPTAASNEDLMPLKDLIGEARIVSLGEATHGTREFFQMKHRLLRFLVEEMGFNAFGIEATMPESFAMNTYIHTGDGDPAQLLSDLRFWTVNTAAVLDMVTWMQGHNANPGPAPTVSFFGIDMQSPKVAMDLVMGYVQKVDPDTLEFVRGRFSCLRPFQEDRNAYGALSQAARDQCTEAVEQVHTLLLNEETSYTAASSEEAFAIALQNARLAVQGTIVLADSGFPRDFFMAENASWILDHLGPDSKVVLWAHNGHVSTRAGWMGAHLRQAFGEGMVVFGFSFFEGSFTAFTLNGAGGLRPHTAPAVAANSYERHFRSTDLPRFFLDLRGTTASSPSDQRWLTGPLPFRFIGCCFDPARPQQYAFPVPLPDQYDVIIYFQETSPSIVLPFQ